MSEYSFHASQNPTSMQWYSAGPNQYNTSAYNYSQQPSSTYAAPAGDDFENEPPLLEELGIDIGGILSRTKSVLLQSTTARQLEDLDLWGAVGFIFLMGTLHLLLGRTHFGVILGWSVVQAILLWWLVNQVVGEHADSKSVDLYFCCCLLGYCMLPVVLLGALTLVIKSSTITRILALLAAGWSSTTASKLFVQRCPSLSDARSIVTFPCFLMYCTFALLTVY